MIYLDYNATAPYSDSVKDYIQNHMVNDWANPSSEHDLGYDLARKVKTVRGNIAEFLGVSSKSLIFTGSATESINTVLSPETLDALDVKTIVTSKLEHHATLDRVKWLEGKGYAVRYIENDQQGKLDLESLERILNENEKCFISVLYVNNEIGTINPIKEISKIAWKYTVPIHIDAVQALGKIDFDLESLGVYFASFAGHKIGAMKGVGLLFSNILPKLRPLMNGGGQERGLRPGTINYPAIKSFELAISDIDFEKMKEVEALRDNFEKKFLEIPNTAINGIDSPRVGNTSNIYLGGMDAGALMLQLGRKGVMVSTGSACSSGSFEPSHVIKALGFDKDYAKSCLRISLGSSIRNGDIEQLMKLMTQILSPS